MDKRLKRIIWLAIAAILLVIFFIVDTPYRNSRRLQKAIKENDIVKVQELLDEGIDPNIPDTYPGAHLIVFQFSANTPLAVACEYGNYDIVKLLFDYGATTEVLKYTGWAPLQRTVFRYQKSDLEIIKLLIEEGADINIDEIQGFPVYRASSMFPRIYSYDEKGKLVHNGYDEQAAKDITEIVKLLMGDRTPDYEYGGKTLLMAAVYSENVPLVEYFLSLECDVNMKNKYNGKTAYDYAVETGNQEIIDLLS